jgi:hypothetical protein
MFTRRSLIAVARAAARNVDSSAFVAIDFSGHFSTHVISNSGDESLMTGGPNFVTWSQRSPTAREG